MNTDEYDGHTPGPWDYEYGPMVSDHEDDTDVLTIKTPPTFDEDKAWVNQRLAAAAPALLAALIKEREENARLRKDRDLLWDAIRLSGTGGNQEEEIAFWHEKLLNMNEAELKEAFKGHYEEDD